MPKRLEIGNLYGMNQAMIRNQEMSVDMSRLNEVVSWAFHGITNHGHKYLMFLCREKNDYTIFRLKGENEEDFKMQLTRLVYSRGLPVGINFNKVLGGYEFWIRSLTNNEDVHMYALFNCNDFMIEIGR